METVFCIGFICLFFKIEVKVEDKGEPSKVAAQTATVTVSVLRNLNSPNFDSDQYSTVVLEDTSLNSQIYQVSARDNDLQVIENFSHFLN